VRRRAFLRGCGCLAIGAAARLACADDAYVLPPRIARPEPASEEGGLWAYMDRAEQRLRRSSFLIRDPALNRYVRDIACHLAGEHCPDMRVYLVRTPYFNASMAPNGMMQVWSGLLLRAANEAQLAAIIGHEIGHYLARHSLERLRDMKSRTAFGRVLGMALGLGGASFGQELAAQMAVDAGAYAYSRDHERDADRIGLELMHRAGYEAGEASLFWRQLLEEREAGDAAKSWSGGLLFATHPAPEERQKTLAEAAARMRVADARTGADTYRAVLAPHRGTFLLDEVRRRRFGESMVLLGRLQRSSPEDAAVRFFKGEAYRLRAQSGDAASALEEYRAAEGLDAPPVELYRSMGLVLRQLGQPEEAARAFGEYLKRRPDAEDAELIRTYLPGAT
jgi:beta-barrel assembly-enhancing protease